jgi:hypothetical protein
VVDGDPSGHPRIDPATGLLVSVLEDRNDDDRWNFDVATKPFSAHDLDPEVARHFVRQLRRRIMPDLPKVRHDGFVFLPLQGRLREHRSFQSMSPIDMIRETLARDSRPIVATLHPKENYDPLDIAALEDLTRRFPRFTLDSRPSDALLAACDAIVTQNSSLALSGALLGKPTVLFARIDFHHIFGSVPRDGIKNAFESLQENQPEFERYLYWFLQLEALNAGRTDFEARVQERLRTLGWPV